MHFRTGKNGEPYEVSSSQPLKLKSIPLYREMAITSWNANISGTDADLALSEKASFEYTKIFTDTDAFNELKELKGIRSSKGSPACPSARPVV